MFICGHPNRLSTHCHLQALGLDQNDPLGIEPDEADDDEPPVSCEPPPAYPALQARRDSVRGWLCALYAFAAPNRHAAGVPVSSTSLCECLGPQDVVCTEKPHIGFAAGLLRQRRRINHVLPGECREVMLH